MLLAEQHLTLEGHIASFERFHQFLVLRYLSRAQFELELLDKALLELILHEEDSSNESQGFILDFDVFVDNLTILDRLLLQLLAQIRQVQLCFLPLLDFAREPVEINLELPDLEEELLLLLGLFDKGGLELPYLDPVDLARLGESELGVNLVSLP